MTEDGASKTGTELHAVGVTPESREALEGVDPKFVRDGLLRARDRSWELLSAIRRELKAGMSEDDGRRLALSLASEMGTTKHWHRPYVRFGRGTLLTWADPMTTELRLTENDPVFIDLGPVWASAALGAPELALEYEGDVGDTFAFGVNPVVERCADAARALFEEAREGWRKKGWTGAQIYRHLRARAPEVDGVGYRLVENAAGHRIADFPHKKYSKASLGGVNVRPTEAIWVLEVQLAHPSGEFGAFYEDLL